MGSAFLLPNAQSFSSGDRDSPTQPGRRCEMAAGGLYQANQHSPQVLRPRPCRELQGADRGWQWQRLPQNGLQLRASQSSESQIDPAGSGPGDFPVEQLWRVSQAGGETSALAAGGPVAGRARDPKDSSAGREEFARQMERRRTEEEGADYKLVWPGWCLGSENFRKELLAAAAER